MKSFFKAGTLLLVLGLVGCVPQSTEEPQDSAADTAVSEAEAAPAPAPPPAPRQAAAPAAAPATSRPAAATQPAPRPAQAQALAPPPAPAPRVFEIPEGTALSFTLIDALSTETAKPGDTFQASLSDALMMDGVTVIPRNALATGRVLASEQSGRVSGLARIELVMTSVQVGGAEIALETVPRVEEAESTKTEDATKIGIGAGIGAAIGGLLGGGGGAAKGAAIGGGAGTGAVLATRGEQIVYPSETRLEFTLGKPVMITGSR